MVRLKAFGAVPATAPVLDILSLNPGVGDAKGVFSYVGYKGGSEPGALNTTWLLKRKSDGAWRVVTAGFNDTSALLDMSKAVYLASAARALAGR